MSAPWHSIVSIVHSHSLLRVLLWSWLADPQCLNKLVDKWNISCLYILTAIFLYIFDCMNMKFSCKLQIWIRAAWISTIRPYYIASSDIESDIVPQTRSIQFVSIPSRRKWRLLVYRTSVPQLKQKDWLLVQILRISFQNQPWHSQNKYNLISTRITSYHSQNRHKIDINPTPLSKSFSFTPDSVWFTCSVA